MGRAKDHPDVVGPYRLPKGHRYPRPAASRLPTKGGKVHVYLDVPPSLYDQILAEAKQNRVSFARQALEYLSAGACPE